jgi:hypothetical protein
MISKRASLSDSPRGNYDHFSARFAQSFKPDADDHDCSIGQWVFSEACQSGHILTAGL